MDLSKIVRAIPDFPIEGVLFRDITTVLQNGEYFKEAVDQMAEKLSTVEFDLVLGPESRGFIFGTPIAYSMGKGFVPIRKKGKLPYKKVSRDYGLEYGTATVEIHADTIIPGQRVVIIDDLLATGGTCLACAEMVEEMGGIVAAMAFFIELKELGGREKLKGYNVNSIICY